MHKYIVALKKRLRHMQWKPLLIRGGLGLLGLLLLVQIFYPGDRLLPFASIDKQPVGMQTKQQVTELLNKQYYTRIQVWPNYTYYIHQMLLTKPYHESYHRSF